MMNLVRAALTAAILALAPGLAAADTLNLLVMGQDADPETVRRNTPIFDRVVQAISGELRSADIEVYDETTLTKDFYDLDRVRRSDAELISLAQTVQIVPIHAVTAFEIRAAAVPSVYEGITDLRMRIAGKVIDVRTGRSLGSYEVSYRPGELPALPLNCNRACQIEFVGDQAARVGRDVGAALQAQLETLIEAARAGSEPAPDALCDTGPANAFTITFRGFNPEDMARIGSFLALFKGYVQQGPVSTEGADESIAYETCADAARLEANLRAMFEQTGMEVWLEADDLGFSAAKLGGY